MMTSCILLSAGLSQRFGSPKALAELHHKTVIGHVLENLLSAPLQEIIVVLGADKELITPALLNHKRIKIVYNKDYKFGQTSSFKEGLKNCSKEAQQIMLLPVDCPFVKPDTLAHLIDQHNKQKPVISIPAFNGQKGHPPIFSMELKNEFLALDDSCGINAVARKYKESTTILPVDDRGVITGFNTKEEFDQAKAVCGYEE